MRRSDNFFSDFVREVKDRSLHLTYLPYPRTTASIYIIYVFETLIYVFNQFVQIKVFIIENTLLVITCLKQPLNKAPPASSSLVYKHKPIPVKTEDGGYIRSDYRYGVFHISYLNLALLIILYMLKTDLLILLYQTHKGLN